MEFLDFEVPIKEILDQIDKCKSIENESDVDITKTYNLLQKKLVETKKDIYGNLSAWQRVQLSRHPNRPYTLDYIKNICGDSFLELHGDRNVSDDKAMIGGLGKIDNQSFDEIILLEKKTPYPCKSNSYEFKDGIHIVFPKIILKNVTPKENISANSGLNSPIPKPL